MKTFCDEISPRAPYFGDLPPSNRDKFRYVIFTNTVGQKLGRKFEAYILEHKLGDVISTGYKVNPNSGHRLRVWVWTIDHVALAKWREKFMPNAPKWKPTRA